MLEIIKVLIINIVSCCIYDFLKKDKTKKQFKKFLFSFNVHVKKIIDIELKIKIK